LIIGVEQLSAKEQVFCKEALRVTGERGALIGAVRADLGARDLRPVALIQGSLRYIRSIRSKREQGESHVKPLKQYIEAIASLESSSIELNDELRFGIGDELIWIIRPYFKQDYSALPSDTVRAFIPKIMEKLARLHANRLWHGNITTNNILCTDSFDAVLVDYGMHRFEPAILGFQDFPRFETERNRDISQLLRVSKAVLPPDKIKLIADFDRLADSPELCSELSIDQLYRILYPELVAKPSFIKRPTVKSGKLISASRSGSIPSGSTLAPNIPDRIEQSSSKPEQKLEPIIEETGEAAPAVQPAQSSKKSTGNDTVFYLLFGMACVALVYFYYQPTEQEDLEIRPEQELISERRLESYWESGKIDLMEQIARRAAVDGDYSAQNVILRGIERGAQPAEVAYPLLQVAFGSPWSGQYGASDRKVLFQIALSRLLAPEERIDLDFVDSHPGVVYSLLATLPVSQDLSWLGLGEHNPLVALPGGHGELFRGLEQLGIRDIDHPSVRSAAHFLAGGMSSQLITTFLYEVNSDADRSQRLTLLLPLFADSSEKAEKLLDSLLQTDGYSRYRIWFEQSDLIEWSARPALLRLLLLVSAGEGVRLSDEEMADLLTFPATAVRATAASFFRTRFADRRADRMLAYLASHENNLSRDHVVALLMALLASEDTSFGFIQQWFETDPDPLSVLQLLIARSTFEELDYFSVEASRYLKDAEWESTSENLAGLIGHPEALARSIAYARLDPRVAEERALLEQMIRLEPVERIRIELERKLALGDY